MRSYKELFLFLFLGTSGGGAVALAQTFTLEQALSYAQEHNSDLTAAAEQTEASAARTEAARAARAPQFDASYTARISNNPLDALAAKLNTRSASSADFGPSQLNNPGTTHLHTTALSMTLPIYTGGRISADIHRRENEEQASVLGYQRTRENIAFQIIRAYHVAQAAEQGVEISAETQAAAQQHANTTAHLLRQGRIVPSDKLTAEVNLGAMQGQYAHALVQQRHALDQLKLAIGLSLDDDLQVAPLTLTDDAGSLPAVTELEAQALGARPDLQALRAQLTASQAQIEVVQAANKPQINLVAANTWYDRQPGFANHSWSVMGIISKTFYNGGRTSSQALAARHENAALAERVRGLEQRIRSEVRSAYDNVADARTRRVIAIENVAKAKQGVALIRKRYGEGHTILIDLLQAEHALAEAKNEELATWLDLEDSQASLHFYLGKWE